MVSFLLVLGSLGLGCGGLLMGGMVSGWLFGGGGMGFSLLVPVSEDGEESDPEWSLLFCVCLAIAVVVVW